MGRHQTAASDQRDSSGRCAPFTVPVRLRIGTAEGFPSGPWRQWDGAPPDGHRAIVDRTPTPSPGGVAGPGSTGGGSVNQLVQKPPPLAYYLTETPRAAAEYALHVAARPLQVTLPRGDGHPVLVLPGLLAGDVSTRALRGALRAAGYRVHGWRLGRNIGPTAQATAGMRDRLDDIHQRYGRRVSVIGWSLGGIFARELARSAPTAVRQVITLGSPFRLAHVSQTRAHRLFERFSHLHVGRWELPLEHGRGPLPVP